MRRLRRLVSWLLGPGSRFLHIRIPGLGQKANRANFCYGPNETEQLFCSFLREVALIEFRVVNLLEEEGPKEVLVKARTPEEAAKKVLGLDLVRSARASIVGAKVYFHHPGTAPSVVRLYLRAQDRDRLLKEAKS